MKTGQRTYRLPPCPAWDVEGMESWMTDLAAEGLFLEQDGFFMGAAAFVRDIPRPVRYRLEASQRAANIWVEERDGPDGEALELSEQYGWEYVARRGEFYIYRSFQQGARELNTDPEVQALTLNAVKKRRRAAAWDSVFWAVFYPLLAMRGGLLLSMVNLGTVPFLIGSLVVLWILADRFWACIRLGRLQRKLRREGTLGPGKPWRVRRYWHWGKNLLRTVLAVGVVMVFLGLFGGHLTEEDQVPLKGYTGTLPFATMEELPDGEVTEFLWDMPRYDHVRVWEDPLAPVNVEYVEHADMRLADGTSVSGGLYVDYHQTAAPWIAAQLAREYYWHDRVGGWRRFEPLAVPEVEADQVWMYLNEIHNPTLVLQKGNVVIRALFYQTGEKHIPPEQWVRALAESLS